MHIGSIVRGWCALCVCVCVNVGYFRPVVGAWLFHQCVWSGQWGGGGAAPTAASMRQSGLHPTQRMAARVWGSLGHKDSYSDLIPLSGSKLQYSWSLSRKPGVWAHLDH